MTTRYDMYGKTPPSKPKKKVPPPAPVKIAESVNDSQRIKSLENEIHSLKLKNENLTIMIKRLQNAVNKLNSDYGRMKFK